MATVTYKPVDGERVSEQLLVPLLDCRADGVPFNVNEGHRTWARQEQLVREKGVWSPSNLHGAARPSATAPHIRTGRFDHALDLNNAAAVARWLRAHGIRCTFTVPGEPWHLELNAADVLAYVRRHAAPDPYDDLGIVTRRRARELVDLRRAHRNRPRRVVLRRVLAVARQRAYRALKAHPTPSRRRAYRLLHQLTT